MPKLRAVLFAGGVGQRLWPLSRRNTPKQFASPSGERSSFQLAVERLSSLVSPEDVFVGTNAQYAGLLRAQVPEIPVGNYFLEPVRRDVAAAVAYAFFALEHDGIQGPCLFQWTDGYVKNDAKLVEVISTGCELIEQDPERLVFIGEKPRFASENLGWIEVGEPLGTLSGSPYYAFRSWHYRPPKEQCQKMLESNQYVWNCGYFVATVKFMTTAFRSLSPELAAKIEEIVSYRSTPQKESKLNELYPALPALHFDEAILMRLPRERAVILKADLGWADPGNLYSLKEWLQQSADDSVSRGEVVALRTRDSLLYALANKPVAVMGLDGIMVVDTPDVLLVIHRDSVRNLGDLLKELGARGLDRLL